MTEEACKFTARISFLYGLAKSILNFPIGAPSNNFLRTSAHPAMVNRRTLKLLLQLLLMTAFLCCSPLQSWAQQSARSDSFEQVKAQAEQAMSANRSEEALKLYQKAVSLQPGWAEGWWRLGTLLYERDAFADAAVAFDKASSLSPNVGTAWVMLGLCEFKLNRFNEALEHIQKGRRLGVSSDPQFRTVMMYHEGLLLVGKSEFEKAQDTLGSLCRDGIDNEEVINGLGLAVLRLRFSDLLAGDAALRELVRRAGRAESLAAQKKFDAALVEYDKLASELPRTKNVQYAYGRFLLVTNEEEKAIAAFKREIENTPTHLLARVMIAETKFNLKDFAGGLPYAEEVVKLAPRLPLGHYLLGFGLLETGQTAKAISELEAAKAALPEEPKIYFALGRAYTRANRKDDAAQARATFMRLSEQTEKPINSGNAQPEAIQKKKP